MANIKSASKNDKEKIARRQLLEDIFYDFHSNRAQVYWMNFVRGIFFGLGTAIGGTVVLALIIWLLSQLVTVPYIGDYIHQIINAVNTAK